jgi:hypothetical protein
MGLMNHRVFSISVFLSALSAFGCLDAGTPAAIMGGQGSAPYAAFLEKDGSIQRLPGLPLDGLTYRVAINKYAEGLIGGTSGINAYAAFVAPDGTLTSFSGLIAPGEIYTVSLNESGNGLIGGGRFSSNVPFAARVSRGGIATSIAGLPGSGLIYGVAIEQTGTGIIGGIGPLNSAYAALVGADGALTPLTGLPSTGGIFWVAANDFGQKVIGGQDHSSAYAAFVSPSGSVSPIVGLPAGLLYSVGINHSGNGILGGTSSTLPYAALIDSNGAVTTITGLPTTAGVIYNVALNKAGTGLIAGFSTTGPYGAFVSPNGTLKPLKSLPVGSGFLDGLALHNAGVAIVGGTSGGVPFAALVAPNGTLTYLNGLPTQGEINSIAIATLDDLVPKSIGFYDSWANTQFMLSNTLTQHAILHRNTADSCHCDAKMENAYSIWLAPFGNYVHQSKRQAIPTYTNKIGGAVLGFDYNYAPSSIFGAGIAYAFNSIDYSRPPSHASMNQESAVLYTSWNKVVYINAALWGGLYQASSTRKSFTLITSKSNPHGWNLTPHFEISKRFALTKSSFYCIEPFVMLDWTNNWQSHYREKGFSGFNLVLKNYHVSILRSETGVRFYQTFLYGWGSLVLEEKGSYVNRTPLGKRRATAAFIEADSSFSVETLSSNGQNHGLIEFHLEGIPCNSKGVYGSLDYQGEFGSSFQSQSIALTVGKNF